MSPVWTILLLVALSSDFVEPNEHKPYQTTWEDAEFEGRQFCVEVLPNERRCATRGRHSKLIPSRFRKLMGTGCTKTENDIKKLAIAIVSPANADLPFRNYSVKIGYTAGPVMDKVGREVFAIMCYWTILPEQRPRVSWFTVTTGPQCVRHENGLMHDPDLKLKLLPNAPTGFPLTTEQEDRLWHRYKGLKACPMDREKGFFEQFNCHNNSFPSKEEDTLRKDSFIRVLYEQYARQAGGFLRIIKGFPHLIVTIKEKYEISHGMAW